MTTSVFISLILRCWARCAVIGAIVSDRAAVSPREERTADPEDDAPPDVRRGVA